MSGLVCRSCGGDDLDVFLELGRTPLADDLLRPDQPATEQPRYPLDLAFCGDCTLVQITEQVDPERLFVDNYLYFSSVSDHLLQHSREHAARLVRERSLGPDSLVVEIASNDGYFLQYVQDAGVRVLGIDPSPGPAAAAEERGLPTRREFFGRELAEQLVAAGERADVIVANNVLAHVPDLNGVVAGMVALLADDGLITVENPYVRDLIEHCEFDTIYHEHLCYFSCTSISRLAERHGLVLVDVEYFPDLHGGTLRWHLAHHGEPSAAVRQALADEAALGMDRLDHYADFARSVRAVRDALLALLGEVRSGGARIAAYGAAAKGSTLLNVVGIDGELVDFVVDLNPHKQGLRMPGVGIPIRPPSALLDDSPEYVLLLAWNFRAEIQRQQAEYLRRGGRLIVPVPVPAVLP